MRSTNGGDEERPIQASERGVAPPVPPAPTARVTWRASLSTWLDRLSVVVAFAWTAVVIAELVFPESLREGSLLLQVDLALWLAFAVVFLAQVALACDRTEYLRSNLLTAAAIALPSLRIVGLVRPAGLARLLLLWNQAIGRIRDLFQTEHLYVALGVLGISTVLSAAAEFFFEHDVPASPLRDFGETLWWAATLATTINTSADPVTIEGRIIGWILRVIALAFFGYVAGSIASYLIVERTGEADRPRRQEDSLDRLSGEIAELRTLLAALEAELRSRDESGK